MSRVLTILAVVITLVYPLAVWLGEGRVEPRLLGGLLLLAVLTRLPTLTVSHAARWWLGGTMLLLILVVWANVSLPLKLYPVVVNGTLLAIFAHSLIVPPTVVERLARLREPDLPAQARAYTRRVTQVWCGFFIDQRRHRAFHRALRIVGALVVLQRVSRLPFYWTFICRRVFCAPAGQTSLPWLKRSIC